MELPSCKFQSFGFDYPSPDLLELKRVMLLNMFSRSIIELIEQSKGVVICSSTRAQGSVAAEASLTEASTFSSNHRKSLPCKSPPHNHPGSRSRPIVFLFEANKNLDLDLFTNTLTKSESVHEEQDESGSILHSSLELEEFFA
ncbi:hypothetical protein Droror1_Dr00009513 [Drosera rotundifolia]